MQSIYSHLKSEGCAPSLFLDPFLFKRNQVSFAQLNRAVN